MGSSRADDPFEFESGQNPESEELSPEIINKIISSNNSQDLFGGEMGPAVLDAASLEDVDVENMIIQTSVNDIVKELDSLFDHGLMQLEEEQIQLGITGEFEDL